MNVTINSLQNQVNNLQTTTSNQQTTIDNHNVTINNHETEINVLQAKDGSYESLANNLNNVCPFQQMPNAQIENFLIVKVLCNNNINNNWDVHTNYNGYAYL